MNSTSINDQVQGPPGYALLSATPEEMKILRDRIRDQWLYRLQLLVPHEIHKFAAISMDQYHTLSHLVDHSKIWGKATRIFPPGAVKMIREMSFFKRIEAEFGKVVLGDEEEYGWENISWRLVRPKQKDVGPIHADEWFYEVRPSHKKIPGHFPMTLWMAIYCNEGRNGLKVVPGSHWKRDEYLYNTEIRNDLPTPVFSGKEEELPILVPKLNPGDMIIFNHHLMHGGIFNNEETCRVSIDFTIFVPDKFRKPVPAMA